MDRHTGVIGAEYSLMWLTLALTIVSGVNYLWKNRAVLSDMK